MKEENILCPLLQNSQEREMNNSGKCNYIHPFIHPTNVSRVSIMYQAHGWAMGLLY
jgi:hypothetical protein